MFVGSNSDSKSLDGWFSKCSRVGHEQERQRKEGEWAVGILTRRLMIVVGQAPERRWGDLLRLLRTHLADGDGGRKGVRGIEYRWT